MASKEIKQNAHNGKQGNATRLELFVTLQYLLEKCPDKEHTSKTVELQNYADEKFNILLDRRRANDILDSLVELTRDNPTVLPYRVLQVENKPRYYIEKCLFSEKEIESIAKAIRNDSSISKSKADKYIENFINKSCNPSQREKIDKKLKRSDLLRPRISDIEDSNKDYLEWLRDGAYRFYFKINHLVSPSDLADKTVFPQFRNANKNSYNAGIVYEIIPASKKQIDVCIYLPDLKSAVVAHLDDIVIDKTREPTEQWAAVNYRIGDGSIELDDWLKKYYKGATGLLTPITFKFHVGDNNQILKDRKKSFREFFKEDMQYELIDRTIEGDEGEEATVVQDAVATVRCNFHAFRKWYWEAYDKPYENTVILSPASLNDRLLAVITRRFQKRLSKYGLNSENGREEREMFEKRIKELVKRRRPHREEGDPQH